MSIHSIANHKERCNAMPPFKSDPRPRSPGHHWTRQPRNGGGTQVPFKGSLEGVVAATPVNPPFIVDVLVSTTGNATHLGRFTLAIPHQVNRANGTANGFYQFTAADGDALYASFAGQSFPTPTPSILYIVETATITGGTGRFAGSTGGFTCGRWFDTVNFTTTGSFDGTISSPVPAIPEIKTAGEALLSGKLLTGQAKRACCELLRSGARSLHRKRWPPEIIEQIQVAKETPMWFRSVADSQRSCSSGTPRRQSARQAPRSRFVGRRISIEPLEDRSMLSFSPAVDYSVGTGPSAIVAADFDNDGRLDLATANSGSDMVSVMLGNAGGTFQPARNSGTGPGSASSLSPSATSTPMVSSTS